MQRDIFISGASGVIGNAIARRLFQSGYVLHLSSRQIQKLLPLRKEFERQGQHASVSSVERGNFKECTTAMDSFFAKAKTPYGLVCNAGNMGPLGLFWEVPFSAWRKALEENFFGHAAMIQRFAYHMAKRQQKEGRIVVLSGGGIGGRSDFSHATSYNTAKAALVHLTEALASEFKSLNLTINAVAPGPVLSSFTKYALKAGARRAGPHAKAAAERERSGGTPPELTADFVEFLMRPTTQATTGRLLSARFDQEAARQYEQSGCWDSDMFRLRRIDNALFASVKP